MGNYNGYGHVLTGDRFAYEKRHSCIIITPVFADDWKAMLFQIMHS